MQSCTSLERQEQIDPQGLDGEHASLSDAFAMTNEMRILEQKLSIDNTLLYNLTHPVPQPAQLPQPVQELSAEKINKKIAALNPIKTHQKTISNPVNTMDPTLKIIIVILIVFIILFLIYKYVSASNNTRINKINANIRNASANINKLKSY